MPYNGETPYTYNGKEVVGFLSSGEFIVPAGVTEVEVLVVGGGGSGGGSLGGGGGAGGLIHNTTLDISGQTSPITVTVGAGGVGSSLTGTKGEDSAFAGLTALGGGAGFSGADGQTPPARCDGGSGGGGSRYGGNSNQSNPGGDTLDATQGNDGGTGAHNGSTALSTREGGGGGGGYSQVGGNASTGSIAGLGGDGLFVDSFGPTYEGWYAGGGGGCAHTSDTGAGDGGKGGGGGGGITGTIPEGPGVGGIGYNNGGDGTINVGGAGGANTGGGGGGSGWNSAVGADGGSGIVLIAYSAPTYSGETAYTHNGKEVVAFLQDGEFEIPTGVSEVEVLLVGGGGGGGGSPHGGGGGAGGLIYKAAHDISGQTSPIAVTVGAGGVGYQGTFGSPWPSAGTNKGTNGGDSTFAGLTALGGGGGGGYSGGGADDTDGQDGGSGGGGSDESAAGAGLQPGSTDGGSGNPGGTSTNNNYSKGGGGALERGGVDALGYGGDGLDYSTEFGTTYGESGWFAGGGGGAFYDSSAISSTGGQGGGGNSGSVNISPYNPTDGLANTGGGGGGAERSTNGDAKGGEGGSGIVIIAYVEPTTAPTFPGDWSYRMKITSDDTYVGITGVKGLSFGLTSHTLSSVFWNNVNTDGSDIRITEDSAGTTLVARDVISIDTVAQEGLIRFDSSNIDSGAPTDYFIWFGCASAEEPAKSDTYGQFNAYSSEMIGYWVGGSGTTLNDRSSYERHGTITNATWVAGREVDALDFNGTSAYVDLGPIPFNSNTMSVTAVVKPEATTSNRQTVFCADEHNPGTQQTIFSIDDGAGAYICWINNSGTWYSMSGGTTEFGAWQTVSSLLTGNYTLYYRKNGVDVASGGIRALMNVVSTSDRASIGARSSLDQHWFNGIIEQVMIFNNSIGISTEETLANANESNTLFWSVEEPVEIVESEGFTLFKGSGF